MCLGDSKRAWCERSGLAIHVTQVTTRSALLPRSVPGVTGRRAILTTQAMKAMKAMKAMRKAMKAAAAEEAAPMKAMKEAMKAIQNAVRYLPRSVPGVAGRRAILATKGTKAMKAMKAIIAFIAFIAFIAYWVAPLVTRSVSQRASCPHVRKESAETFYKNKTTKSTELSTPQTVKEGHGANQDVAR